MTLESSFAEFEQSAKLRYSSAYSVSWIDKMSQRVSDEFVRANPQIDFSRLKDFSVDLVDGHWIDTEKVWNFARDEAPLFVQLIEPFVPPED
jgi:uncharacterized protein with HEPN domain